MKLYCIKLFKDEEIVDVLHMFQDNDAELIKNMYEYIHQCREYDNYSYSCIKNISGIDISEIISNIDISKLKKNTNKLDNDSKYQFEILQISPIKNLHEFSIIKIKERYTNLEFSIEINNKDLVVMDMLTLRKIILINFTNINKINNMLKVGMII